MSYWRFDLEYIFTYNNTIVFVLGGEIFVNLYFGKKKSNAKGYKGFLLEKKKAQVAHILRGKKIQKLPYLDIIGS